MKKLIILFILPFSVLQAQNSISLEKCYELAIQNTSLQKQAKQMDQLADLHQKNLQINYLPSISLNAKATYQSEVTEIEIPIPGFTGPEIPKDQYRAAVNVNQLIYDGGKIKTLKTISAQENALEKQNLNLKIIPLMQQVNNIYFSVLQLDRKMDVFARMKEVLDTKQKQVADALKNEMASEKALKQIQLEQLALDKQIATLQANKSNLFNDLKLLTGLKEEVEIDEVQSLDLKSATFNWNTRPEYQLFDEKKKMTQLQMQLKKTDRLPVVAAFVQGGYGRPGLNMFEENFSAYYIGGVSLNWTIYDWNKSKNEQEVLKLQNELVDHQKSDYEQQLQIAFEHMVKELELLELLLLKDKEELKISHEIRLMSESEYDNGYITMADFITDLNAEKIKLIDLESRKMEILKKKADINTLMGWAY